MATRSQHSSSPPTAISVALLTDNSGVALWLQHLLALDKSRLFDCQSLHPSQLFDLSSASDRDNRIIHCDFIVLDDLYGGAPFLGTLQQINKVVELSAVAKRTTLPRIIVLLDDDSVISQVGSLAIAARLGAEQFLLKSDISLRSLLHCFYSDTVNPTLASNATQTIHPMMPYRFNDAKIENNGVFAATILNSAEEESADLTPDRAHHHQLSVDLVNQRLHISDTHLSTIFNEEQAMLDIEEWESLLDTTGRREFRQLLNDARSYHPITDSIDLIISSADGENASATLSQIQINNDGQGRVAGLNATLSISKNAEDYAAELEGNMGFDNLGDGKPYIDNDNLLLNLTRSLPMICLLLDENGVIVSVVNAEADFQLAVEFNEGQLLTDALHIESTDNLTETISRTLNTAKPYQQTVACSTPGGVRWLDTHITKLKGNSGLTRQVVWTAFDITTSRLSYQELLKKHDTLSEMIDNAPVMYFQLDSSSRFIHANKSFCDTYGVRSDVISGRDFDGTINDPSLSALLTSIEDSEEAATFSQYRQSANNVEKEFAWKAMQIKSTGSGVVESIIVFGLSAPIDQTLLMANETIKNNSAASTTTVSNIDDRLAEKAMLNQSTLSLSGAIGQDFKSILSSIVNYTELALSQKNAGREAKFLEYIDQVVTTSQHARNLLGDYDAEAIISSDESSTAVTATALKPLTQEVIDTLQPTLPATLSYELNIEDGADIALVNPAAYRKIVLRLLAGARDDAAASRSKINDHGVTMTLSEYTLDDNPCNACDLQLNGNYIALAVHSKTATLEEANLTSLISAAKQATLNNTPDNVVAMTHHSDGHTLIEFDQSGDQKTLSLIMLFPKTP